MYFKGIVFYFESGRSKKYNQMTFFAFTFANNNIYENETKGTYHYALFQNQQRRMQKGYAPFGGERNHTSLLSRHN